MPDVPMHSVACQGPGLLVEVQANGPVELRTQLRMRSNSYVGHLRRKVGFVPAHSRATGCCHALWTAACSTQWWWQTTCCCMGSLHA